MLNKITFTTHILLIAAVTFLFVTRSNSDKEEAPEKKAESSAKKMPATSKIAFFNTDSVTEKYAYIKEKNDLLKEEERRLNNAIEAKLRSLQSRYNELQQKSASMTDKELEAAGIELREMEQNLENARIKAAQDLEQKNADILKDLFKRMDDFLNRYNKDQKFDYILKYQNGGFIAWGKPALDITDDVIKGLNEEYLNEKKK